MPQRKMRSARKRQSERWRWMVVRVPLMERHRPKVRMQTNRHASDTARPIHVRSCSS